MRSLFAGCLAACLLAPTPAAASDDEPIIRPGHEAAVLAMLGPAAKDASGYRLDGASIEGTSITYRFVDAGQHRFRTVLRRRSANGEAQYHSKHFNIAFEELPTGAS